MATANFGWGQIGQRWPISEFFGTTLTDFKLNSVVEFPIAWKFQSVDGVDTPLALARGIMTASTQTRFKAPLGRVFIWYV
jgi:hypothetical protein